MQLKDWVIIALGVLAVAAVLWNRRWITRSAREVPSSLQRYVKHVNDPDVNRVYQVLGPAETEGFLRVVEAGGAGGAVNIVSEEQVIDVYGYDPSAARMMKLVEAQLQRPGGVPSGRETFAEPAAAQFVPVKREPPKPTSSMRMLNYERGLMQIYRFADQLEEKGFQESLETATAGRTLAYVAAQLKKIVDEAFGKSVLAVDSHEPVLVEED